MDINSSVSTPIPSIGRSSISGNRGLPIPTPAPVGGHQIQVQAPTFRAQDFIHSIQKSYPTSSNRSAKSASSDTQAIQNQATSIREKLVLACNGLSDDAIKALSPEQQQRFQSIKTRLVAKKAPEKFSLQQQLTRTWKDEKIYQLEKARQRLEIIERTLSEIEGIYHNVGRLNEFHFILFPLAPQPQNQNNQPGSLNSSTQVNGDSDSDDETFSARVSLISVASYNQESMTSPRNSETGSTVLPPEKKSPLQQNINPKNGDGSEKINVKA